jgi:hypothetical protein
MYSHVLQSGTTTFDIGFTFGTFNLNKNAKLRDNHLDRRSDFKIVDFLGVGANGAVYNVNHLQTNQR